MDMSMNPKRNPEALNMKNSRVGFNVATSLLQQAATVVCGFIVPRLVLGAYGMCNKHNAQMINGLLGLPCAFFWFVV